MTDPIVAWAFLVLFYLLPLAHVVLSSRGGPWRAPKGARCPFSPRAGWLVIVLVLGAIGWALFLRATSRRTSQGTPRARPRGRSTT